MLKILRVLIFIFIPGILFTRLTFAEINYRESLTQAETGVVEKAQEAQNTPEQERSHYTSYRVTKRIKLTPTADLHSIQCKFPLIRNDFPGQISKKIVVSPNYNALIKDPEQNDIALHYFSNVKNGQVIDLITTYDVAIKDSDFFVSPAEAGENYAANGKEIEKYLGSDSEVDLNNPVIKENARKITQGITNPFSKGKAIYNFIANNIQYENTEESSGFRSPDEILQTRRGNCADMARLFIALARANGIPSRQVNGMVFSPDVSANKSIKKYEHAWAEIYMPKYGWLPVDPTFGVTSREDYYCFNYKIHIRESYGPVIQRAPGSLYRGMYIEVMTYAQVAAIPLKQDIQFEVDLLNW